MARVKESASSASSLVSFANTAKVVPAGYMGEYGNRLWRVFNTSGTFVVPAGITKIRVRVLGAGCGGTNAGRGGCGGGYAHGEFAVTPGASHTVTVGAGSVGGASPSAGGTSSFGVLISATGGTSSAGGTGTGGDFQATGGVSGNAAGSGGGGAGSQLGDGGNSSAYAGSGGGAVCNGSTLDTGAVTGGASAFGNVVSGSTGAPDIVGMTDSTSGASGFKNTINATIRFPFDGFVGAGGTVPGGKGGGGAGGAGSNSGAGGEGGRGGGGGGVAGAYIAGNGGLGAGGGSYTSGGTAGKGGDGLVIVEW